MKRFFVFLTAIAICSIYNQTKATAQRQDNHHYQHQQYERNHHNHQRQDRNHLENQRQDRPSNYNHNDQDHYRRNDNHHPIARHYNTNYRHQPMRSIRPYRRSGPPLWARAHGYRANHSVYFRDYNTFYDPYRGGYVYWQDNRWLFSPNMPLFLMRVDLNSARMQVIDDIPMSTPPERYYDRYARTYPRNVNININVPLPPRR